jgi:hypothetical protein
VLFEDALVQVSGSLPSASVKFQQARKLSQSKVSAKRETFGEAVARIAREEQIAI